MVDWALRVLEDRDFRHYIENTPGALTELIAAIQSVGFTARTCAHVLWYSFGWFEFSCSKRIYLRVYDTFTRSFHASLRPEYSSDASMCVY